MLSDDILDNTYEYTSSEDGDFSDGDDDVWRPLAALFQDLYQRGTTATGTVRRNRHGVPGDLQDTRVLSNEVAEWRQEQLADDPVVAAGEIIVARYEEEREEERPPNPVRVREYVETIVPLYSQEDFKKQFRMQIAEGNQRAWETVEIADIHRGFGAGYM
ncbi:hypothetical protein GWK47_045721 [Chionoecetes opilio]|uniref:PiggyBac transposable element-derived protein domain-containing protein n=1 Tax=Chionoecetes opilio TaxID=41210 RepID=A0A8J4YCP0_CHIOP|nr:hypothetical protein GWK47_045721 [Chionoecetes opilio]